MIGRIIGALAGREVDRRDGDSGVKGMAIGAIAMGVVRRMGPLGVLLGGGYVAKQAYDRRRARKRSGRPDSTI